MQSPRRPPRPDRGGSTPGPCPVSLPVMAYFTLDATFSGAASNTYIGTVSEMRNIAASLAVMPGLGVDFAAFNAATDDALVDLAVIATNSIDNLNLPGFKKQSSQARQWPRVSVRRPEAENVIPDGVKFAQVAEMAALASAASEATAAAESGVTSYTVGKKSVTLDPSRSAMNRTSRASDAAVRVLGRFGLVAGTVSSVYMPRA